MSLLSIEIPATCSNLITESAFENYTLGRATEELRGELNSVSLDRLFPAGYRDESLAQCCVSGLWLLHNFLDESHEISQEISSREGSYWHGIMHRMEGDFWNSKYWYRKVGNHSVFDQVQTGWDPESFVDQVEAAQSGGDTEKQVAQQVAVTEWKCLFEFCFENAS